MKDLYKELYKARKKLGMTQATLAQALKIPQGHISNIEQGKIDMRLSTFVQMSLMLEHEPILVPRQLLPAVKALLAGRDVHESPRFLPDDEDDDDD